VRESVHAGLMIHDDVLALTTLHTSIRLPCAWRDRVCRHSHHHAEPVSAPPHDS
jgi:hypothetical protein